MKNFAVLCCLAVSASGALIAQEVPRFSFSGGAGFTTPSGDAGTNLDTGWNIRAGAGVNFTSHLGAMLDLGYDSMGGQHGGTE